MYIVPPIVAPAHCWFFTWNNPDHNPVVDEKGVEYGGGDGMVLFDLLSKHCRAFGFQYEEGENGTPHYQGQVQFLKRISYPSELMKDPDGELIFQGIHWEKTRFLAAARNYCSDPHKKGFLDGPWVFGQVGSKCNGYTQALVAKDKAEALSAIRTQHTRDWYNNGERIIKMVDKQFKVKRVAYVPRLRSSFVVQPHVDDWVGENIGVPSDRYKMLVMFGESMLGKTQWARSLGPHIYWKGLVKADDLLELDCPPSPTRPKYLIVDDIDWKFVPDCMKKSVLLGTGPCIVTDRYLKKLPVNVDIPCIYLMNPNEGDIGFDAYFFDEAYWKVNTVVCKLGNKKLF